MATSIVLTDTEIRRVFRIIDTTRHAERNRLCFRALNFRRIARR